MWILELLCGIIDIAHEIEHAKRFGWGDFWLGLAWIVCLLTAMDQFGHKHYTLGTLGVIATAGCIFCFVKLVIRSIEDFRSARDYAEWKQNQEKKKSEQQANAD